MANYIPGPKYPVGTKVRIGGLLYDEEMEFHTVVCASCHGGWTYRITDFDMECAPTALEKYVEAKQE